MKISDELLELWGDEFQIVKDNLTYMTFEQFVEMKINELIYEKR